MVGIYVFLVVPIVQPVRFLIGSTSCFYTATNIRRVSDYKEAHYYLDLMFPGESYVVDSVRVALTNEEKQKLGRDRLW